MDCQSERRDFSAAGTAQARPNEWIVRWGWWLSRPLDQQLTAEAFATSFLRFCSLPAGLYVKPFLDRCQRPPSSGAIIQIVASPVRVLKPIHPPL